MGIRIDCFKVHLLGVISESTCEQLLYRVSMTNALMADLTFEHRQTTLWSDQDQPDISEFDDVFVDLLSRCRVWFEEGLIMSDDGAASDTYTRQVLNFYRSPRFAYSGNSAHR